MHELPASAVFPCRQDLSLLVAHDLKSPMATIALNLEFVLAEAGAAMPLELRNALQDCIAANAHAAAVVGDMAEVSRMRDGDVRVFGRPVDLCAIVSEALERFAPAAAARRIKITARLASVLRSGDARLLTRAVDRAVDWTVRHAGPGDEIEVRCRDGMVTLQAAAAGLSAVRPSLAMHYADMVMRAHGGRACAEVDRHGGLLVSLALP